MPAELDKIVKGLLESDSFKKSYARLKAKQKGFAKKFPTLKSYAFARANVMLKKRGKSAAESFVYDGNEHLEMMAAGFLADAESVKGLFKHPDVVAFLESGEQDPRILNSAVLITQLAELDKPASPMNAWGLGPITLSSKDAETKWQALVGKPVHVSDLLDGHQFDRPLAVGSVLEIAIDRRGEFPVVLAACQVWDRDHAAVWDLIQDIADKLGASFEVCHTFDDMLEQQAGGFLVENYHPTGMAILRRSHAAHSDMRVLAASAYPDAIDGDGSDGDRAGQKSDPSGSGGSGQAGGSPARSSYHTGWPTKGARMLNDLSPAIQGLVGQFPEESRAAAQQLVAAMVTEMQTQSASAEEVGKLNTRVGELEAQVKTIEGERDTLDGKVKEYERQNKVAGQRTAATEAVEKKITAGEFLEKDKEELVLLFAKKQSGESLTGEEVDKLLELKTSSADTAPLPGETGTAAPTSAAGSGMNLSAAERDKLVEEEAVKMGARPAGGSK